MLLRGQRRPRRAGRRRGGPGPRRRAGDARSTPPGCRLLGQPVRPRRAVGGACRTPTDEPSLVSANALSTTSGAVATVVGGGAASACCSSSASGDSGYAALALARGAALPRRRGRRRPGSAAPYLGPDHLTARPGCRRPDVVRGMVAGARHVVRAPAGGRRAARDQPAPALLRRPHADDAAALPEHVRGDGGAVPRRAGRARRGGRRRRGRHAAGRRRHPAAVRRIGKPRWITLLLVGRRGGAARCWSLPFVPPTIVLAGLVLGFVAQGVKICVDTTLQESVEDDFRGRVFSVYDTLFNVTFVAWPCWSGRSCCPRRASARRCCWSSAPATCSPRWPSRGGPGTAWPTIRTGCPTRRAARPRPRRARAGRARAAAP